MAISVDPMVSPRIIIIPETDGNNIAVQNLVNQIREWEHELLNLGYDKLLSASGKEELGGSTLVGITAKLENAKLKFEGRESPTLCNVSGGNLVAVDSSGNVIFPIEPSDNVTVQLAQSSSATLIQSSDIGAIKAKTDNLPNNPANETTLLRALGLSQENICIDNFVFDSKNNLTSSRIRIYDSPSNVGTVNGIISTYYVNTVYQNGKISQYEVKAG